MRGAAGLEEFERAAHLRDAIKTIETLAAWRNKMEAPALGDRECSGSRQDRLAGRRSVPDAPRRIADRIELVTGTRARGRRRADPDFDERGLLAIALPQFTRSSRAPRVHTPVALPVEESYAMESWLSERAGRRVLLVTPSAATSAGCWELAARNASCRISPTSARARPRPSRRWRRSDHAGPARAAKRIEVLRYLDISGPRNGRVDGLCH